MSDALALAPLVFFMGILLAFMAFGILQLWVSEHSRDPYIYQRKSGRWTKAYRCPECQKIISTVTDGCPWCGLAYKAFRFPEVQVRWVGAPTIGFITMGPGHFETRDDSTGPAGGQ